MRLSSLSQLRLALLGVCFIFIPAAALPQTPAPQSRIVDRVDEGVLVTLRGNTHPAIRSAVDLGLANDAQPITRMLLLLQRGPDQESALLSYLEAQQSPSSPAFHQWLTPAQFGQQFGPADADIQAVTNWLQSHGFQVIQVARGRTVIEFSGNVGQVRVAFHTQIRRYFVDGQERLANASDPQIPAALAPVVAGVVSLSGFRPVSHLRNVGTFHRSKATGVVTPLFTPPDRSDFFPVAPGDFAKIYNVAPLLSATPPINGAGQSIAVVGESNIQIQDIVDFRNLFGLPQNFSSENVILNGIDPGINPSETESDLDIEWAGAVAPGASVEFVTSSPTETTSGIHLSAVYAVDNNIAAVLSESFGECEQKLGATGNQFYNSLWEQAAAQGITVILSSGDGGSAGCDDFNTQDSATLGLAVSGFASTPFNVAVGGTDFDQANVWSQYWNSTNDPVTQASVKGYIPEIPWNDSCAQLGVSGCGTSAPSGSLNIIAGSGGPSTIYAKPPWQTTAGVPQDNKRDLPDVSLFAGNGFTGSLYIVCQADIVTPSNPTCALNELGFTYQGIGGTSASAPAFAGIMALVNQRQATAQLPSPRQGNANYVLYALAQKQATAGLNCNSSAGPASACTFNDITKGDSALPNGAVGTNSVPCAGLSPNCSSKVSDVPGTLVNPANQALPAWTANAGYDLVTGLGSVNAQNLVNNWNTVTVLPSTTTLSAKVNGNAVNSISGIAHGQAISVSSRVAAGSGASGTPSGQVTLLTTPNPEAGVPSGTLGIEALALLNGTATGTGVILPGGTYTLSAHYQGDGKFGPSDSSPGISVNITTESSKTLVSLPEFNVASGQETTNTPSTMVYGSVPYIARVDVGNVQASLSLPQLPVCTPPSCPSGSIALTDSLNGSAPVPLDAGNFVLNDAGFTEDFAIELSGGSHQLTASYSGDSSYNASTGAYSLTVTPAATTTFPGNPPLPPTISTPFGLSAIISTRSSGAMPSCNVSFFDGTTLVPGTVTCSGQHGAAKYGAFLQPSLTVTQTTAGPHTYTAKFNGDANYAPSTGPALTTQVSYGTTMAFTADKTTVAYGATVTFTATVNTLVPQGPALPSAVSFFSGASQVPGTVIYTPIKDASGNIGLQAVLTFTPQSTGWFYAYFNGDSTYSASAPFSQEFITVNIPDFTVATDTTGLTITSGQSATAMITVTPASNTTSPVTLSCLQTSLPASAVCTFSPPSLTLTNGTPGTSMLTLTTLPPSGSASVSLVPRAPRGFLRGNDDWQFPGAAAGLISLIFLAVFGRSRRRGMVLGFSLSCAFCLLASCGTGGGGGGGGGGTGGGADRVATSISLTTSAIKTPNSAPPIIQAKVTSTRSVTGTVTFFDLGVQINFANVDANGNVVSPGFSLYPGTHVITAAYSGDVNNLPSQTKGALDQVFTGTIYSGIFATTGGLTHAVTVPVTIQ